MRLRSFIEDFIFFRQDVLKEQNEIFAFAISMLPVLNLLCFVPQAQAASNKELKIAVTQDVDNLNPLITSMSVGKYVFQMVGHALVTLDAKAQWIPQLVKAIPAFKNKITAIWELRDNAFWGDGVPVTCADLAFTLEVGMNDNLSIPERSTYAKIKKIEWNPKTPKKCLFTYDKVRWDFYQLADFHPLPEHLERPIYEKFKNEKEGYERNSNYSRNPSLEGLYNGPYKVVEYKVGDHLTLIPNDKFYGSAPKIKKIQILVIANTGTLEANLRSGTIDLISSIGFSLDQAAALEKRVLSEKMPYSVLYKSATTYEHIDLNLDNPILQDLRVRKALMYAIHRQQMIQALFAGKQQLAPHLIAPRDPWFTEDSSKIVIYNYDRKQAEQLLDQAGWQMGNDHYRYKDGHKLSLSFMTTLGNKSRESVQVFLQNQWKAIGIEILIKNQPARLFFSDTIKHRLFTGMIMYSRSPAPESTPRFWLDSHLIPSAANNWSGKNFSGYKNPAMDGLLEKLDREISPAKRKSIASEILHLYTNELPAIPLFYGLEIAVIPAKMKGFELVGHDYTETNNIQDWSIEAN